MLIIPVLDLSRGVVVHAKQGERNLYQPITSVISLSSEPESVLSAFLELYPFKIIYIADLDAIQGIDNQYALIKELSTKFNQCEFWVDAGIESIQNNKCNFKSNNIRQILGSENILPPELLAEILNEILMKRVYWKTLIYLMKQVYGPNRSLS